MNTMWTFLGGVWLEGGGMVELFQNLKYVFTVSFFFPQIGVGSSALCIQAALDFVGNCLMTENAGLRIHLKHNTRHS